MFSICLLGFDEKSVVARIRGLTPSGCLFGSHLLGVLAPIKWVYRGNNRWIVSLPSSDQYEVLSSNQMRFNNRKEIHIEVRYWSSRLFDFDRKVVFWNLDYPNLKYVFESIRKNQNKRSESVFGGEFRYNKKVIKNDF